MGQNCKAHPLREPLKHLRVWWSQSFEGGCQRPQTNNSKNHHKNSLQNEPSPKNRELNSSSLVRESHSASDHLPQLLIKQSCISPNPQSWRPLAAAAGPPFRSAISGRQSCVLGVGSMRKRASWDDHRHHPGAHGNEWFQAKEIMERTKISNLMDNIYIYIQHWRSIHHSLQKADVWNDMKWPRRFCCPATPVAALQWLPGCGQQSQDTIY